MIAMARATSQETEGLKGLTGRVCHVRAISQQRAVGYAYFRPGTFYT